MNWESWPGPSIAWSTGFRRYWRTSEGCCSIFRTSCGRRWRAWASRWSWRVPGEALARIFDPFYRVENDRDRTSGGVGLGLAIARRAVELHKGTIRARNANPGLIVEISLPGGAS